MAAQWKQHDSEKDNILKDLVALFMGALLKEKFVRYGQKFSLKH